MLELLWVLVQFNWLVPRISNWSLEASTHFTRRILFKRPGGHEHWGFVKKKIWKHCQQTIWKSMFHQNSYCKELSHRSSESFPCPGQDLESEKAWPTLGKGQTEAAQHSPSQRLFLPGWLLPSQPQLPPLKPQSCDSSDDQKARAAPKIGSRRNWKASAKVTPKLSPTFKWSPSHRSSASTAAAAADLDPLPQPQQPAQEEKEDKHEKEDKQDWVQPSGEPGCRQQWVCIRISGSGADSTPGIKLRA